MLIAFEGIDCVGKTLALNIVYDVLKSKGVKVAAWNDWESVDHHLKDIVINSTDSFSQLCAILIARRSAMSLLSFKSHEFDVVLLDRYSLSTIVYQDVLTFYPDMIKYINDCTLPHDLFYIMPSPEFDRKFFLNKRTESNAVDESMQQGTWLKRYDYIIGNNHKLAEQTSAKNIFMWNHKYAVANGGTEKFIEGVRKRAEMIAERIREEK